MAAALAARSRNTMSLPWRKISTWSDNSSSKRFSSGRKKKTQGPRAGVIAVSGCWGYHRLRIWPKGNGSARTAHAVLACPEPKPTFKVFRSHPHLT